MAAPIIQKNGSSSGLSAAGKGSNDLVPGETLTIADLEGANDGSTYFWEFVAVPRNVTTPVITDATTATPSFTVDSDQLKAGSYEFKGTVDGDLSSSEIWSVPLKNTGGRIPAQREKLQYDEGTNVDGWHEAETEFKRAVDAKLGPAETSVDGLTRLSVAPASPTVPIAVGDNDSRNTDARTPTAHTHTDAALLTAAQTWTAGQAIAQATLSDGAGIVVDIDVSNNFELELAQNSDLANPINVIPGTTINIAFRQNGTGGFTLGYGTAYKFTDGAPVIPTGANNEGMLSCYVRATAAGVATSMVCSMDLGPMVV